MSEAAGWRRLRGAAWLTLALHALAGAAMLLVLGRGLATNPDLNDRLRFLAERTTLWRAAWATWNLAALSVLYFFQALAAAHREDPAAAAPRGVVAIGACAVAADLTAEAALMFRLPALAAAVLAKTAPAAAFLAAERGAVLLTGGAANALYSTAAVVLAWSTRRRYPAWTWRAGLAAGAAGAALTAAAVLDSARGMFWTNAMLVPAVVLWQYGVAREAGRRLGPPAP